MISKDQERVKVQDVVQSQLPSFVREDFPLIGEFLKQYYISQEYQGSSSDLLSNIDLYLNLDSTTNLVDEVPLFGDITAIDTTISVDITNEYPLGTKGFPDRYGLIQIDDEIILYTSKQNNTFLGCIRGFSGVTSYKNDLNPEQLVFSSSQADSHTRGTLIKNLSNLFLKEFLVKVKKQISPGFESRELDSSVNQKTFLSRVKDFYKSKGTVDSFKILFKSLYNEDVDVLIPSKNLFRPSDANYSITRDLVVESISGDPFDLLNRTLYQDAYTNYGIGFAYGSVGKIEKISVEQKDYYKLSVDFDYSKDIILDGSIFGTFSVHPKTKVITQVSSGSSFIDVDSTIGFPKSGTLSVSYDDGTTGVVTYTNKSYNQFFDVTGVSTTSNINSQEEIRLDVFAYGYSGIGTENPIKVNINSVLSELNLRENTFYYNDGDTARVKSLGIEKSIPQTDCWKYNIQTKFDIDGVPTETNPSDHTHRCKTHVEHNFTIGDKIVIRSSASQTYNAEVVNISDAYTFSFNGQNVTIPTTNLFFTVERKLSKPSLDSTISGRYSYITKYNSDIQNVYSKFNNDTLVATSSIPSTKNLKFSDKIYNLSGPYSGQIFNIQNHGYYTGDSVYYSRNLSSVGLIDGLPEGTYLIKKIDENNFKLSTSLANIYASYRDTTEEDRQKRFISVSAPSTTSYYGSLSPLNISNRTLQHQNALKEIKSPVNDGINHLTEPGTTGILINGVEVLNYKSSDYIYYGKINSLEVSAQGNNYDVINPPIVNIQDEIGTGATANCSVSGSLSRIDVIDSGFDYLDTPIVTISGGNGRGATAEVNSSLVTHSVNFFADSASSYISTTSNTIGFSTYHKFRNYESVVYKPDGQTSVGGLSTDSLYYVGLVDAVTLKLYENQSDAISGINTISLSSFGSGVHRLVASNKKRVISAITITNPGTGYANNKKITLPVGINTALDQINIEDHGYNSEDIVTYSYTTSPISGISSSSSYIVTKVDNDNFKLSQIGTGETSRYFYYNNNEYVNLQSQGEGIHTFNYETINVSIVGSTGVTTFSGSEQNLNAVLQPVFRGQVYSTQTINNGSEYGVSDIFNFDRQPVITLLSGDGARLLPIISNGGISEVLVISPGSGYNSPPDLNIIGTGKNAKVTPVIQNGQIVRVVVNRSGSGYNNETTINVVSAGSGAKLKAKIQSWNINLFEKNLSKVSSDDGFLAQSEKYGIKYTYLYAPRKLRRSIYGRDSSNVIKYGDFDLTLNSSNQEVSSTYHSPIIGWAYDGNPIYGPYGFTNPYGGSIRLMRSGYSRVNNPDRPSEFPEGFFVEDYVFTNTGDLDEHNGRFCVTPEFPNGVYAYFATFTDDNFDTSGVFANYKRPIFPYLIGNTFKSKPNEFNFNSNNNQIDYDLSQLDWFRNTKNYNLNKANTYYDYLVSTEKIKDHSIDLRSSKGSVNSVKIISGGNNYKVGDRIIFESSPTSRNALARVEKVSGKEVVNVSTASTVFSNVEITNLNNNGGYIAFTTSPHSFVDGDIVYISGLSTNTRNLQRNFSVGVSSERYALTSGVGTIGVTGIVTYFNVTGNLNYPFIREDDILAIESENVKVLSIDNLSSRIRVLRQYNGTTGSAHTSTTPLVELTRKVRFTSTLEDLTFETNKKIYFNPEESLGVGTDISVGAGITLSISNPGSGSTQVFVPTRSIFLPNHGLSTGERITYTFNDGSSIGVSTNGIDNTTLTNNSNLYVAKINNDLIGISTFKVGLGSTGTFVGVSSETSSQGLLYLTGIGTGSQHSFKTNRNSLTSELSKNLVTVSLASTQHLLSIGNNLNFDLRPSAIFTIIVKYDDYNRRIVFNPKSFIASDVDIEENSIYISNHSYKNGDKVIHTSVSPSGGLINEKIYYVIDYTPNKIKLSETYYGATTTEKKVVNISSASVGTISEINPQVIGYRNSTLRFDVSDSSLSYSLSGTSYSAFKFNLYEDSNFTTIFESTQSSNNFEVTRNGSIGFSGAYVDLRVANSLTDLYYKFTPVSDAPLTKNQIVIDNEVTNHNKIYVTNSDYVGNHRVTGIGSTTFNFNLNKIPEKSSYNTQEASISYKTNSPTASGPISEINIVDPGSGYENSPGISTIRTQNGSSSILLSESTSIGSISSYKIRNIGFDYPSDNTLRPVCNLPEILRIEPLSSFDEIGITSAGRNYLSAPSLVVIDSFTNRVINDVDLRYNLGDTNVTILKNTFGIYNREPRIIPINNTNGVGIRSIFYNQSTQNVSVHLNAGFSDSFPFSVGDRVLIENASVGIATTGYGYNSQNYNYTLFTLSAVSPGLGGNVGVVTYNISEYLPTNRIPGNFDSINSSARIVAEKEFPIFRSTLKKNNFSLGEDVKSEENFGVVESWNDDTEILKVSTEKDFSIGDVLIGQSSRTQGIISNKYDFNSDVSMESSSVVDNGWESEIGFLNKDSERISDNFYYQKFSYSLKSRVPLATWEDPVSSLNHTAGYKKFSDLIIESEYSTFDSGTNEFINNEGVTDIIVDLYREKDIDCYSAYDFVTENSLDLNSRQVSDEVYLRNTVLTDYFESIGNRVLSIDDFSNQFNSNERAIRYSVVDRFNLDTSYKKYFFLVQDTLINTEKQISIVSLLQDGSYGYLNQYGRVESTTDLGYYDFAIFGSEGELEFYPTKYRTRNYNITHTSFNIKNGISGIGTFSLGDVVKIDTTNTQVFAATTETIVSIANTYRSSKIIVQIKGNNGEYEVDELNLIHDDSNVEVLEYGQIRNTLATYSPAGLGTYNAYIDGNNINLDFTSIAGVAVTVNTVQVSIANTSLIGIGTTTLSAEENTLSELNSSQVSIPSNPSPSISTVTSYSMDYCGSYFVFSVEDKTNNIHEMSEVVVLHTSTDVYLTEYGNVSTSSESIGAFSAGVSGSNIEIYYTPNPNIDVDVRSFRLSLKAAAVGVSPTTLPTIDLNNSSISADFDFYYATLFDLKRDFELTHNGLSIFKRDFDASNTEIVDTSNNTIRIPNHFFVTGEEVSYTSVGSGTTSAIGIGTTSFVGVGTTDKLPSSVFIIKVNDSNIKLARTAEDALKVIPIAIDLTSVGVGSGHTISSLKQNTKCLIALDNLIQSPIVSTSTTTYLSTNLEVSDFILNFDNVLDFIAGDLIKVDDEIMKINTVGFGSTNRVLVDRPWMGTGVSTHSSGSLVTKVIGDYNITGNTINFIDAPYGNIPIGSTTNDPDERDWVGITTRSKFQGRTFLRNALANTSDETYLRNYIFDDISHQFDAITKDFTLRVESQNITGIEDDNAVVLINNIFQSPSANTIHDYTLVESAGITSIRFTGSATSVAYDPNNASIPLGGVIVSVGSTNGFGYQPLVAAGGTAVVSIAGTISSISIGNSGSGYRSGIQTTINVGVVTSSVGIPSIEFIGTAAVSNGHIVSVAITNPGSGYTSTNPPIVVFDSPLNYSNIPLIYSSSSSGVGTQAIADIIVGQGSSVIDFEIKNTGYSYSVGDVLTFEVGGTTGIPTDISKPFEEFQITIDSVESDKFSGWHLGQFEVLDDIDSLFDGQRRNFPLLKDGSLITIRSTPGSNIDIQSTLLIFLNDVLQVPGEGYTFTGGTNITFTEAPKGRTGGDDNSISSDKCRILFYKGSGDVDVIFRDVLETIKKGDKITINDDEFVCSNGVQQDERIVFDILSSDTLQTNTYDGPGINGNPSCYRTIDWCKQKNDLIIDGTIVSKSRNYYEPIINPVAYLIQPVGIGSTILYVDSIRPFFNQTNENSTIQNEVTIISQDELIGAAATAIVSVAGTITSISITNGGSGYVSAPSVSIQTGVGTTAPATATASITSGIITAINVTYPGTGYTSTQPPLVLIQPHESNLETNDVSQYYGDFGKVVGFGFTTSAGISTITFDLWIETDSFMRDSSIVGTAVTISNISIGDFIVVSDSNVGFANTSITSVGSDSVTNVSIGTEFFDNVYQVKTSSIVETYDVGLGTIFVNRITVLSGSISTSTISSTFDSTISNYVLSGGITTSTYFGSYSWGKIYLDSRSGISSFNFYGQNGLGGISTSSMVRRTNPLKYISYL